VTALVLLPLFLAGLTTGLLFLPLASRHGYRKANRDAAEAKRLTSWQLAVTEAPDRYRGVRRRAVTWPWNRPTPVAAGPGPVTEEFEAIVASSSYRSGELPAVIGQPGKAFLYAHMRAVAA